LTYTKTPVGKATAEDPARSCFLLLRKLRRCPRKAKYRSTTSMTHKLMTSFFKA